jgi:hypothetical protein
MFLSASHLQTAPVYCRAEPERDIASILGGKKEKIFSKNSAVLKLRCIVPNFIDD